jgi:hypothetical protein
MSYTADGSVGSGHQQFAGFPVLALPGDWLNPRDTTPYLVQNLPHGESRLHGKGFSHSSNRRYFETETRFHPQCEFVSKFH